MVSGETMSDELKAKTFWVVIAAGFLFISAVGGFSLTHSVEPYHAGMPMFVETRVDIQATELLKEIKLLREDIHTLREALIRQGSL